MIPQETIQQIVSRIDIIEIVNSFVKLRKRGQIISACALFTMKNPLLLLFLHPKKFISALGVVKVETPSVF